MSTRIVKVLHHILPTITTNVLFLNFNWDVICTQMLFWFHLEISNFCKVTTDAVPLTLDWVEGNTWALQKFLWWQNCFRLRISHISVTMHLRIKHHFDFRDEWQESATRLSILYDRLLRRIFFFFLLWTNLPVFHVNNCLVGCDTV